MPTRDHPEYDIHKNVAECLRWQKPDCVWFHVYNGAYMSKATAGKSRALGVLAGVADLVFVLPGLSEKHPATVGFIELKAPKGALSDNQKAFRDKVKALRAWYAEARSIEDVQQILRTWGVTFAHARGRAA